MHEFMKYAGGSSAPYDMAHGGERFSAAAWWRGVKCAGNAELAVLAEVLHSVVPHAAPAERPFGGLGYFQSRRRSRHDPDTTSKLMAVRRALRNEERGADERPSEESDEEDGDGQEASLGAEELVAELGALAERLAPLFQGAAELAADAGEPRSFVQLLTGNWDGFDMQAQLHPGFVPEACVAEVPGRPLGPAQRYDVAALLR